MGIMAVTVVIMVSTATPKDIMGSTVVIMQSTGTAMDITGTRDITLSTVSTMILGMAGEIGTGRKELEREV